MLSHGHIDHRLLVMDLAMSISLYDKTMKIFAHKSLYTSLCRIHFCKQSLREKGTFKIELVLNYTSNNNKLLVGFNHFSLLFPFVWF